jgi:hypothetical protein
VWTSAGLQIIASQEIVCCSKNMFVNVRNIKMFSDCVHIQFLLNFYTVLTWNRNILHCSWTMISVQTLLSLKEAMEQNCLSAGKREVMFTKLSSH